MGPDTIYREIDNIFQVKSYQFSRLSDLTSTASK